MRYAIKTSPQHTTWADLLAVWQAADEIDLFESAWTFDHFYPIFSDDSRGPCLEGWSTLTALAQATQRIRVGCLVTGTPYRQPAAFANLVATVDVISDGRLELGLGAGWNEEESGAMGIDLAPTWTERFDRFEEVLEVLTRLFTGRPVSFDGRHHQLRDAVLNPVSVQQPHPPICIGGTGERRTLPLAARFAQHWNYPGFDTDGFVQKRDALAAACAAVHRDPAEIMTSMHVPVPVADLAALIPTMEAHAAAGLDLAILYLPAPHRPEVVAELADVLRRAL
ncbi:MAG: TIGR03560 family F420-dependent LLM class oxidoreductase [Acidimicrobiia bacterium]|nr:TIGR03560 family F420-dependent LLM class oxidoreductase [Acidimicrobiia bacterium]